MFAHVVIEDCKSIINRNDGMTASQQAGYILRMKRIKGSDLPLTFSKFHILLMLTS
jgi:hypothetical protein